MSTATGLDRYKPSGPREAQLLEAANLLMDARRTHQPIDALPAEFEPATLDEIYWVQDTMMRNFGGEIGGWKVGAPAPGATPLFSPMPAAWMGPSNTTITADAHRYRGVEAEIAFLMGEDLLPRATPYTDAEVYAAVRSGHPAIELLESALIDPQTAPRNSMLADLQVHGGFIYGPACDQWRTLDWNQEHVTLTVDGSIRVDKTGSETCKDLNRLLPWLANEGAWRTGGLRAGQWVTTGSWTGNTLAMSGSSADAHFSTMGRVSMRFQ